MNHHHQDPDRTEVASDQLRKNTGILQGIFKSATRESLKMFKDIALSVSKDERLNLMVSKYRSHLRKLRDLFGWDAATKREVLSRSCDEFPKSLEDTGDPIPLQYLTLAGIGAQEKGYVAVLNSNMETDFFKTHSRMLSASGASTLLARWRQSHPILCEIAECKVREHLREPMAQREVLASLCKECEGQIVITMGIEAVPVKAHVVNLSDAPDSDHLVAFLVSLFYRCPLAWMFPAGDAGGIARAVHPFAASMLSAQFDPGVKWTATSRDGCARMLELQRGVRQILPRPGIPLSKFISERLWKLLGELSPQAGDDISLWGSTRENAAAIGIMFPRLSSVLCFALLQSGLSPALRRIVCLTPSGAPVDNARLIMGLLEGSAQASVNQVPQHVVLNAFLCLERLLHPEGHEFGVDTYKQALSCHEEEAKELFCIAQFVAELRTGQNPDETTIAALRRHYVERGFEDEPEVSASIRIAKKLLSWILIVLVHRVLRTKDRRNGQQASADGWERDSRVIKRQKRVQQRANAKARKISESQTAEMLAGAIRNALVFRFTKRSQNLQARVGNHFPKLVSILADFLMLLIKRSEHGVVLEQRMWEEISRGCDLTMGLQTWHLFRHPSAEMPELPSWLQCCDVEPGDLIEVDLTPLCERVRSSSRIKRQIESIRDISECAGNAGWKLSGLSESCRIDWGDDLAVITKLSPESILRELRPPVDAGGQQLTDWWLEAFGMNGYAAPKLARKILGLLFDQDPEAAVVAMLEVAAANSAAVGDESATRRPVVYISKSQVLAAFQSATRTTNSDKELRRLRDTNRAADTDSKKERHAEAGTGTINSESFEAREQSKTNTSLCRKKDPRFAARGRGD